MVDRTFGWAFNVKTFFEITECYCVLLNRFFAATRRSLIAPSNRTIFEISPSTISYGTTVAVLYSSSDSAVKWKVGGTFGALLLPPVIIGGIGIQRPPILKAFREVSIGYWICTNDQRRTSR